MSNVQSDWTRHGRCCSNSTREEHSVCNDGSTISSLVRNFTPLPQEALHGDQSDHSVTLNRHRPVKSLAAREKFVSTAKESHLAHRISQLLRARRARRLRAFLLLNERHERAPFTTATIAESPRSHFQATSACVGALRPYAPVGGFAKRVVARRRDYDVVVALLLASGRNR